MWENESKDAGGAQTAGAGAAGYHRSHRDNIRHLFRWDAVRALAGRSGVMFTPEDLDIVKEFDNKEDDIHDGNENHR